MYQMKFSPSAEKYLKKIRDKQLMLKFKNELQKILADPQIGEAKRGDLQGVRGVDVFFNKTNYEIAYMIGLGTDKESNTNEGEITIITVLLVGTRENFYEVLKRMKREE